MFEHTLKAIDDVLWEDAGWSSEPEYTEQTSWMLCIKNLYDLEHERNLDRVPRCVILCSKMPASPTESGCH